MSLVAVASFKASPGVTTSVLALGHVWPADRRVLVVEADPAGGDLAAWAGLPADPSLGSLAAAGRRGVTPELVDEHVRSVAGISVLTGPIQPAAARAALAATVQLLPKALSVRSGDVLIDCGRLDPESPATQLIDKADLVIVVARPTIGELPKVAAGLRELRGDRRLCLLLAEGARPERRTHYPPAEVASAVGVEVMGTMPSDPPVAGMLWGGPGKPKALQRSPLIGAARGVAQTIVRRLTTEPEPGRSGQQMAQPLLRRRVSEGVR